MSLNIVQANIEALKFASSVVCVLRKTGFIVAQASDKSQYASAHFLRFLIKDEVVNYEYRLASLRSSVDNCVSLIEGLSSLPEHSGLEPKEISELKRTVQDIPACVQSIVEGAEERYATLVMLENMVAKPREDAEENWNDILDGSRIVARRTQLNDVIATPNTSTKMKGR